MPCVSRLRESASFVDFHEKSQFPGKYKHGIAPAQEEMFGEEYPYNMIVKQHLYNPDRPEYLDKLNGHGHLYHHNEGNYLYSTNREYLYYVNGDECTCVIIRNKITGATRMHLFIVIHCYFYWPLPMIY